MDDALARSLPPSANEFPIRSSAQLSTREGEDAAAADRLLAGDGPAAQAGSSAGAAAARMERSEKRGQ